MIRLKLKSLCVSGSFLKIRINGLKRLESQISDNAELIEMGEEEGDDEIVAEAEEALRQLQTEAARQQIESLLSGEADGNDSYLEIHSGAGGTESQDWAKYAHAHVYALG